MSIDASRISRQGKKNHDGEKYIDFLNGFTEDVCTSRKRWRTEIVKVNSPWGMLMMLLTYTGIQAVVLIYVMWLGID